MWLDFLSFLHPGDTLPHLAVAASLFSFGKKKNEPMDLGKIEAINKIVSGFLEKRGITRYKVFTTLFEGRPVVHIQAEAHKNLRFSNLIEIRLRKEFEEKLQIDIGGIFWRFQMDFTDKPSPELADYEEYPTIPPALKEALDKTPAKTAVASSSGAGTASNGEKPFRPDDTQEFYDIRRLAKEGIEVQELSISELDAILGTHGAEEKSRENSG
jgi:adenylate kinase family enzyme